MKVTEFCRKNKIFHKSRKGQAKGKMVQRNQQNKFEVEGKKGIMLLQT